MLVEQSLQLSVPLLDTFFLSRVSDSAASAAGAMTPALFFCVNILWVTVFAGSSIASQRMGAGSKERAVSTIATYALWIVVLGCLLAMALYWVAPLVTSAMGLPEQVRLDANIYMQVVCWLMIVWAAKLIFQSILNVYGQPQWNMYANVVFFTANLVGNAVVVFGLFGFPKLGIVGVAWASVIASFLGIVVSGSAVYFRVKLGFKWQNFKREFRSATNNTLRIALPSMVEPLSFDLNMIVLNGFAASLGAAALAAKIYTFNTFLLGLIISLALTMATQVLVCERVGAGAYDKAKKQLFQSLKVALWGSAVVVCVLLVFHHPVMDMYTDDEWLLGSSFWLFLLAALSEPPRAINVMVGGVLRATGDGFFIAVIGPLFTWLVALPAAYVMAFVLGWGIYGILLSAVLDEGCRSVMYWMRWRTNRWQHTHVHARESKQSQ